MTQLPGEITADGYYDHDHADLLKLIAWPVGSILEIGCATGTMLRHCLDKGAQRATGVEYVESVAARARGRCPEATIFSGDVDSVPLHDLGVGYDLMVAGFVLEHVTDPWKTLSRLRSCLRPGGQFVGSLPNVRHWGVTIPLLFGGKWEYQDEGVLDRTHYRFFTKHSIDELLTTCGFENIAVYPMLGGPKSNLANKLTLSLARNHFAYAYSFSATTPAR